jgi:hypothetical protein
LALPDYETLMLPVLKAAAAGEVGLSEAERGELDLLLAMGYGVPRAAC